MEGRESSWDLERAELLRELVPPLVHRLNNSLAVVTGALCLQAPEPSASGQRELDRITSSLRILSGFAQAPSNGFGTVDLNELLRQAEELVRPLAAARGVALEFRPPARPAVVSSDAGRLAPFVLALVARAVLRAGPGGAGEPVDEAEGAGLVRVSLVGLGRRVALSIVHTLGATEVSEDAPPTALLLAADRSEELRCQVLLRPLKTAVAFRLVFEGVSDASSEAFAPARPRPTLALFECDASLRELIASVLTEAGFEVRTLDAELALDELDAELVVLGSEHERDRLVEQLLTGKDAPPVLLLGHGDRDHGLPTVAQPIRPDELLRAVERTLDVGRRGAERVS